jgi:hypothetical protein
VIPSIADGVVEPSPKRLLIPRVSILTPVLDATANGLTVVVPWTKRVETGVEEPIPTLPVVVIVMYCVPEDDATANGLRVVVPWTRKAVVADVALIPETVPLSRRVPMPRVLLFTQRAMNPFVPPATDAVMLSVEVATHLVDVPVDWRSIPRVPVALVVS